MADPVLWFEVIGRDGKALREFYSKLFGWEIASASGNADYGLVTPALGGIAGGVGTGRDGADGHVTFFVGVDDPAAYLEKVEKLGGKTIVPPMENPDYNLTFAYFADPEGHVVGLAKGIQKMY